MCGRSPFRAGGADAKDKLKVELRNKL